MRVLSLCTSGGADLELKLLALDFELLLLTALLVSNPSSSTMVSMGDLLLLAARARPFALLISLGLGRIGRAGSSGKELCFKIFGILIGRGGRGGRGSMLSGLGGSGGVGETWPLKEGDLHFLGVATGLFGPSSLMNDDPVL